MLPNMGLDHSALFRIEAIDAQRATWLGDIRMCQPLAHWLLGIGALCVATWVVGFLFLASYTQRTTVSGRLIPIGGQTAITATQSGRILEVRANEGARVSEGDVLVVLTLEREALGASHEAKVAEKLAVRRQTLDAEQIQQARLAANEGSRQRERVRGLQVERSQLEVELATVQARCTLAEQTAARFAGLAAQGFVSSVGAQAKEEEVLELRARLESVKRSRMSIDREIADAQAELVALPTRAAISQTAVSRQQAVLEQEAAELSGRRTVVIRAAHDGVVTALSATTGQWVAVGQNMATLLPANDLVAELYAPSRAVGFVQVGQAVRLRYAPFPYQKFGQHVGEVMEVSLAAIAPRDMPPGAAIPQGGESVYRVKVKLAQQTVQAYGDQRRLAAGTQLEADIELDSRRLIEWVFEPLLALKGRVI